MSIGKIAKTCINNRELIVDWQINDFFALTTGYYPSECFNFSNECWYFKLFTRTERSGEVNLFLCKETGQPTALTFTFGIRGLNGVEMEKQTVHVFGSGSSCFCLENFCYKSNLRNSWLVQDRKVIISCHIKTNSPLCVRNVWTQTSFEAFTIERESAEKEGGEKALEDFGKLLASGEKSDITIQVGDVEFKVHRAILFARSPALSVSLHHESKEKTNNKIVVEDCKADVFKDLLHYIYTGSIESLTPQNVFGLFTVADKYLAEDLKSQCLKHISNTLCVQTFCPVIKLALMHGEDALLDLALHFATQNIQSIIISVEWQEFICEYPRQANEILIKCLVPQS